VLCIKFSISAQVEPSDKEGFSGSGAGAPSGQSGQVGDVPGQPHTKDGTL
jgi:hypothetical protein